MAPTASADDIRRAYRALARRFHPDTGGGATAAEMAAVNEAWRVLSDPARRAMYDASLRSGRGGSVAGAGASRPAGATAAQERGDLDDDAGFSPMKHPAVRFGVPLPWILVLLALGVIFVFTAYAVRPRGGGGNGTVDGVIEVGSCVTVAAVGAVTETACEQPHEGRVVAVPGRGLYCADGTEAYVSAGVGSGWSQVVCVRRG